MGGHCLGLAFIYSPYSVIYFVYCMNGSAKLESAKPELLSLPVRYSLSGARAVSAYGVLRSGPWK